MTDEQRFYIGTAEAVEAEFGETTGTNSPFVVYETYADEGCSIEGFATLAKAKAALADVPRSMIEYL